METVNDMLRERALETLDLARYREIFTFPIIDYYREAGFDFSIEPYERLAEVFIEKNNLRLGESGLYEGAIEVIGELRGRGYKQLVLSASRQDILEEQMSQFSIRENFETVLGKRDFYAYGKAEIAEEWLARTRVDARRVVMVGDTQHDDEVARAIGCDCILIASGHQSKIRLEQTGRKTLVTIAEILSEL